MTDVSRTVKLIGIALLAAFLFFIAGGVRSGYAQAAAPEAQGLRVFLDCDNGCNFDYLRREVTFVNYVRDRQDAQIHVPVTRRQSGAGREWILSFIDLEDFAGRDITLDYNSSDTDTEDQERAGYAQVIRIGLLNYLADTPLGAEISIEYQTPEAEDLVATAQDDPWNSWVFETEFSAEFQGEQRTRERSLSGSFEADRTTEVWLLNVELDGTFDEEEFELSRGGFVTTDSREWEASREIVRSLGPQWGASVRVSTSATTYQNQDQVISVAPGVEYNFFPYEESSRRLLTLTYETGLIRSTYEEEMLFDHALLARYAVTQPWGEASGAVLYSQFLNHTEQHRAEVFGNLEIRITRGLAFEVSREYSRIRDQRFLPKEDISDQNFLLERLALATDYEYEFEIGFSYTFGSIFNNVVNPRFEGRRGGGGFF
jgi:hypothetical protein